MAQSFSQSWIEKVKDASNIVSVISKYVPLKQKGNTYWGNCPFHHEKEPSFAVNSKDQYYHCFGCGEGGSVIRFIEQIEKVKFQDALRMLAEQNGIELPEGLDDEAIQKNNKLRQEILEANLIGAKFYNKVLMSDYGKDAREYLYNRGLTNQIITRFGLGYSPNWTSVVEEFKSQGKLEIGEKANIICKKGDYRYDFFAERVVFPIINTRGEVTGFSARNIKKDAQGGKYKNSQDSIVFNKSNTVYAINLLKKLGREQKLTDAIIVEGQMDVIALHQAGFRNAVACMGTALTPLHAKELKRFVDRVYVCFDGDGAGQKATNRSLEILENEKLDVRVIALPENLDPDEYIKKYGSQSFQEMKDKAKSKNDFIFETIRNRYDIAKNNEKTQYIKETLDFIAGLKTKSEQEIYLKQLKDITQISLDILRNDMEKGTVQTTKPLEIRESKQNSAYTKALICYFASLIYRKPYAENLDIKIIDNTFFDLLKQHIESIGIDNVNIEELEQNFTDDDGLLKKIKDFNFDDIADQTKYYNDCKITIKEAELNSEIDMIKEKISEDKQKYFKLLNEKLKQLKELKTQKNNI